LWPLFCNPSHHHRDSNLGHFRCSDH
jgi:hypothetical protein